MNKPMESRGRKYQIWYRKLSHENQQMVTELLENVIVCPSEFDLLDDCQNNCGTCWIEAIKNTPIKGKFEF